MGQLEKGKGDQKICVVSLFYFQMVLLYNQGTSFFRVDFMMYLNKNTHQYIDTLM